MESDVLAKYNMTYRSQVVRFIKSLWSEMP